MIRVSDPDAGDGIGYVDEATGESKDFGTALRAAIVLGGVGSSQKAQITPLTELATRKIVGDDGNLGVASSQRISDTNIAIGQLFGVTDIVGGTAPDVVDNGTTSTSDAYGNALALLSGMDAVNTRLGAENAMEATLARLASSVFVNLSGNVAAQFSSTDVDTLSLLSQGVAEVAGR